MTKTLKNAKMMEMLYQLEPLLNYRGRIGYVAARNTRVLRETLTEYVKFRDELIEKYGEPEHDKAGNILPLFSINVTSPNFKAFNDELAPYNEMEHEVELMTATYQDAEGVMTGAEILAVEWMLTE